MSRYLTAGGQLAPTAHAQHFLQHGLESVLHQYGEADDGDEDAVYLGPLALGLAALLLIINGLLSVYLSLGLHKTLGIAAVRQVVHLFCYPAGARPECEMPLCRLAYHSCALIHACSSGEIRGHSAWTVSEETVTCYFCYSR